MKAIAYFFVWLFVGISSIFPVEVFSAEDVADQVIIRRTTHGVPHVYADNLRAAGYAIGYVQIEDYRSRGVNGLVNARGESGKYVDVSHRERQIDYDATNRRK